jgi:hypothetical protein
MGIRTERAEADLAVPFIIYITLLLVIVFPIGGVRFRYARTLLSRIIPSTTTYSRRAGFIVIELFAFPS